MNGKVQIRDVAERAGVSVGTVSNVLNGLPSVKPANLARVQQAMDELGFVPNFHARQLRIEHGDAIGLIVLSVSNPFYAEIAHVAEAEAEAHGALVVMGSSDNSPERETRYLNLFEASNVRGLLIAPVGGVSARLRAFQSRGTPTILLDDHAPNEFCSVSLDGHAAGRMAAQHLVDIGRRRVAVVGGPLSLIADRVSGASSVLDESGGSMRFLETPDLSVEAGRLAAERIMRLAEGERPDAVFAANDLVALGLMQSLILAGLRIPNDIAIVGYDDIDFAATAIVPLTSVRQPREEIARAALELVIKEEAELAGSTHVHERRLLVPTLSVRTSTSGE
jgi:LacI family transcriptional regulator